MPETRVGRDELRDPVGKRFWSKRPGRDPGRTPMHWSGEPGAGFSTGAARPWLPFGDVSACNVADQRSDPSSTLNFCRELIAVRRGSRDLRHAPYEALEGDGAAWAWRRGGMIAAVNLGAEPAQVPGVEATIVIATDPRRAGESLGGALDLGPWEGVIAEVE
jgi:alpha-glucosidase